jgi:hypothetical protein
MKASRRKFLQALGVGTAGVGIATLLPMGLLGVAETKHERLSQQILKSRILDNGKLFDRMHVEMNEALSIINNEFDYLKFEDALFVVATMRYALRDCYLQIVLKKLTAWEEFHLAYTPYLIGLRNDPDPIVAAVIQMLEATADSNMHFSNVLRGYYPELPGKRTIV